jgi:hypothetical protein
VTPDYERTFSIHFSVPLGPAFPSTSGRKCARSFAFESTLRFEQTAAEWTYDPNGPCICE